MHRCLSETILLPLYGVLYYNSTLSRVFKRQNAIFVAMFSSFVDFAHIFAANFASLYKYNTLSKTL